MKKISKKVNNNTTNVLLLTVIVVIILMISSFYIIKELNIVNYYKLESRIDDLAKAKKEDPKDEEYVTEGWLKVQGTNIDYPVIYGPNYDFSYKTDNFVWTEALYDDLNNITYISGHNILNLSINPTIADKDHTRFEQLMSFTYLDFVKDNKYIQYSLNGKEYIFKIFAVSYPDNDDLDLFNEKEYTSKEMKSYIKNALDESIYDFDIDVNEKDKVISLVTCTRMYGYDKSFKVDARLVRNGEKITNYGVQENDNYKELENVMKGGNVDESKA